MQKIFLILLTFLLVSSIAFAELKLKLPAEITGETTSSIINKNIEQNLKLTIPAEAVPPADMKEFVKGMIMLGILADVSIPMGSDDGFKHIASTGYSGHIIASYVVATSFLISLRGGYISFGTQTQEGEEFGQTYKWENKYSLIPILLGGYYLIQTGSGFKPYVGAALGVFIQNYEFTGTYSYDVFMKVQQETSTETADVSSTGFGIVPAVGFYYLLGSVALQVALEYTYLFSELKITGDDYSYTSLGKESGILGINQEEYEENYSANYISINVGVNFPLGQ